MTVTAISNAKYITADNSIIDMTVTDDRLGTFPFTYSPNDPSRVSKEIFAFIEQGGLVIAPYEPVPITRVPAAITRRQMLLMLMGAELITPEEALAAATAGTAPPFIVTFFDGLPNRRTAAYVTWATMSVCERSHPFIEALARIKRLTDAQVDDYFRQAATL